MTFFNQRLKHLTRIAQRSTSTQSKSHQCLPFDTIPGPKPLPFIGNLWRYLPVIGDYKPDTLFENALFNRNRYGPIVREKLTNSLTILHLFDPQDIESFARQDGKYPHRRSHRALLKYRRDRPDLYQDGGLFPENGDDWYRQRAQFQQRLLSKSEVAKNIEKLDTVSKTTVGEIRRLTQGNSTVLSNFDFWLYRWALGNSLAIFLDVDINKMSEKFVNQFLHQLHNALQALDKTEIQTDRWIKQPDKCPHYRKLVESQDFLYGFVSEKITESSPKRGSYLAGWLQEDKLDKRDVISFVIDSLLAGLHTTSYTVAFLLYHISKNKTLQDELRTEVRTQIPEVKTLSIDRIDRLHLLRNCLKETLRMNPISIGTGRLTSQEGLIIRGYEIPKGIMVITQNQVISCDESTYSHPNDFKPDRWSNYRVCPRESRPSPFATLPFGFGARSCIGQRLAELQIKIMSARLLQNFEIVYKTEIPTKTTLVHNLDGAFEVEFRNPIRDNNRHNA